MPPPSRAHLRRLQALLLPRIQQYREHLLLTASAIGATTLGLGLCLLPHPATAPTLAACSIAGLATLARLPRQRRHAPDDKSQSPDPQPEAERSAPAEIKVTPAPAVVDLAPPPPPTPGSRPEFQRYRDLLSMVPIPAGTFLMGSKESDPTRYPDELPRHPVTLPAYEMGSTLVTRALWRKVVADRGPLEQREFELLTDVRWLNNGSDERLPANNVSWIQAAAFCNVLSDLSGLRPCYQITPGDTTTVEWAEGDLEGYRLPTEAEWERACRGDNPETQEAPWFFGARSEKEARDRLIEYAWWDDGTGSSGADRVHPVGEKKPNPFGIFDIYGNCWEWCWDWYGPYRSELGEPRQQQRGPQFGEQRVLRGGSAWYAYPRYLRSAYRLRNWPSVRIDGIGFRLVRSSPRQP